ncbi:MAG: pyridoxal kinase PdxY [Alphaproteobacteria bacterium]|nr:pyridoxal kinase PdxY [Alphaproteobacteria bacterium]
MRKGLTVLSIQSDVVRGHVGNGAARFALQRLGIDVWAVPTVLLSNHPGHGTFRGEAIAAGRIADLIDGLAQHGWLKRCDGVISGYLGAADQTAAVADAVRRVKAANAEALYLCDPVFGDDSGAYARAGVAEAMARDLLPLADILTPNRFELSGLTSRRIETAADAVSAARTLGNAEVVATSVPFPGDRIGTVAVTKSGAWATAAARLERVLSGSGDLFAALYLAARLRAIAPVNALVRASSSVDCILRASAAEPADELTLVASQNDLAEPAHWLDAVAVSPR